MSDDQLDEIDQSGWQRVTSLGEAKKQICPSCGEDARLAWSWCRGCTSTLDKDILVSPVEESTAQQPQEESTTQQSISTASDFETWDTCPSCGVEVSTDWIFCRACESPLASRNMDSDSEVTTTSGNSATENTKIDTLSQSHTGRSSDTGTFEIVCDSVNTGDRFQDGAGQYSDAGEYDPALEAYDKAREAYKDALETAKKSEFSDLIDTDVIEQRLTTVEKTQREVNHQRLQDEIGSLDDELDHADNLYDEGNFEEAQERLEGLASDVRSIRESASQSDFEDLLDELASLEQQREEHLKEVTKRLEAESPPDEVPSAPGISVDYDALADKESIGGGGTADVTKATLPTPDGDITLAIKKPRLSGTLHTEQVERLLDEAETWDQLDDHDHIVGVVDYGSEPVPWIAMEYMDSGHLGERSGKMELSQALWTALAVTKGVRHAHTRGVAHLDLKPENVLFRSVEHAWDVPKVADWGLSKHLLNHSKSIEGMSPHYAAPEQFEQEFGPADNFTDVYQLGAVFYELFTGRPPFEGRPTQVMRAVLNEEPTPPSEVADVPEALDDILLTALGKKKDDRYDDIIYLRDALEELFESQ